MYQYTKLCDKNNKYSKITVLKKKVFVNKKVPLHAYCVHGLIFFFNILYIFLFGILQHWAYRVAECALR